MKHTPRYTQNQKFEMTSAVPSRWGAKHRKLIRGMEPLNRIARDVKAVYLADPKKKRIGGRRMNSQTPQVRRATWSVFLLVDWTKPSSCSWATQRMKRACITGSISSRSSSGSCRGNCIPFQSTLLRYHPEFFHWKERS